MPRFEIVLALSLIPLNGRRAMLSQEIPYREWEPFLNRFSQDHDHETVSVEFHAPRPSALTLVQRGALAGIHLKGRPCQAGAISLLVGNGEAEVERAVANPRLLRLYRATDGADRCLTFESSDGSYTVLRFAQSSSNALAGTS
jgi:hypothetical protein